MEELMAACPTLFSIVTEVSSSDGLYRTTLQMADVEAFQAANFIKANSREKAMQMAYDRLNNLSFMIGIFRSSK